MLHHTLYPATNNSKKWITFIHGAGGSSSIWFNQVRFKAPEKIEIKNVCPKPESKANKNPAPSQDAFARIKLKNDMNGPVFNLGPGDTDAGVLSKQINILLAGC